MTLSSAPAASSTPVSARGFVGSVAVAGASQEIDSVRELNRLLESALRMGGAGFGGNPDAPLLFGATDTAGDVPDRQVAAMTSNLSSSEAASWRLDTSRRLCSLLSSQKPHTSIVCASIVGASVASENVLVNALRRQSRYWIPLLLSWLKGGSNDLSDYNENSSALADLPLTNKQRRQQRQKNATSSPPEVQIEALRALTSLTEWLAWPSGPGSGAYADQCGGVAVNNISTNNAVVTAHGITSGCSPHTPLSTSSQRLLLRHADAVPMIVSLLSSPDPAVHEQAVWILGSIAGSGLGAASLPSPATASANAAAAEVTRVMTEHTAGGIVGLEGSLSVSIPAAAAGTAMSSNSIAAAVNMAAENPDDHTPPKDSRVGAAKKENARDVIFAAGAMGPLLKCLADNPNNVSLHRVGAWCLSSLVEGRYSSSSSSTNDNSSSSSSMKKQQSSVAEEIDVLTLLPTIRRMLHMDDTEVLTFTCWTLSHLCDGPAYHIAAVIYSETGYLPSSRYKMSPTNGLVPRLVELLLHPSPKVAKPALRTVGNIVCADCSADQTDMHGNSLPVVDFTEIILECHAVPCLRRLIGHHNREIAKEACWTLSNIAAGTASQIQAVIDSGAIPPLVELVNNELTDKEVRSEACWVVLNATSCGNDDQISILIEEGCVSVLGVLLTEPNMVMMALEGIERVLQTEEAQDSEDLYHKSEEELGQRPTIIRCAGLIKAVKESPHNSSAVSKRARRIWDHHFVSCALCHNNYSRCRLRDSHFCNECKCHVCSRCDCRVYHLSYQEELWAEDEERAAESKKNKKSKKAKKKQKAKEKAEKKRLESQAQAQQVQDHPKSDISKKEESELLVTSAERTKAKLTKMNNSKNDLSLGGSAKMSNDGSGPRNAISSSPSRGTIESDAADSLGGEGAIESGGRIAPDEGSDSNSSGSGQPPIDLVLFLQQTGSIISLAKLIDSLYDNEFEDEEEDVADEHSAQQDIDLNHHELTTQ